MANYGCLWHILVIVWLKIIFNKISRKLFNSIGIRVGLLRAEYNFIKNNRFLLTTPYVLLKTNKHAWYTVLTINFSTVKGITVALLRILKEILAFPLNIFFKGFTVINVLIHFMLLLSILTINTKFIFHNLTYFFLHNLTFRYFLYFHYIPLLFTEFNCNCLRILLQKKKKRKPKSFFCYLIWFWWNSVQKLMKTKNSLNGLNMN